VSGRKRVHAVPERHGKRTSLIPTLLKTHIPVALHKKNVGILYTLMLDFGDDVYTPKPYPCSEYGQTAVRYPLSP